MIVIILDGAFSFDVKSAKTLLPYLIKKIFRPSSDWKKDKSKNLKEADICKDFETLQDERKAYREELPNGWPKFASSTYLLETPNDYYNCFRWATGQKKDIQIEPFNETNTIKKFQDGTMKWRKYVTFSNDAHGKPFGSKKLTNIIAKSFQTDAMKSCSQALAEAQPNMITDPCQDLNIGAEIEAARKDGAILFFFQLNEYNILSLSHAAILKKACKKCLWTQKLSATDHMVGVKDWEKQIVSHDSCYGYLLHDG